MPVATGPSARAQYRSLYRRIAVTDVARRSPLALLLAYWIRFGVEMPTTSSATCCSATPIVVVGVFASFHLYEAFRYTPAEEFRRIILAVASASPGS